MIRTTLGRTLTAGVMALGLAVTAVAGLGARPADASCPLCPQPGGPAVGGPIVVGGPTVRAARPDLVVEGAGVETLAGGELHVGATIRNEGAGTAKGPITVAITKNGALDRSFTIDALAPGASQKVSFAYNNPLNPSTTLATTEVYHFCITAMVAPTTVAAETDLSDNSDCVDLAFAKP